MTTTANPRRPEPDEVTFGPSLLRRLLSRQILVDMIHDGFADVIIVPSLWRRWLLREPTLWWRLHRTRFGLWEHDREGGVVTHADVLEKLRVAERQYERERREVERRLAATRDH